MKLANMFQPFKKVHYIQPELDIDINPDEFIKWLKAEEQMESGTLYKDTVSGCCEYACLYIAMKLVNKDIKGKMYVRVGDFGFWEHYWCEYHINNKIYIIDLTLQQFLPEAPRLAISKPNYNENSYMPFEQYTKGEPIEDYCTRKMAFQFYTNPNNLK